MGIRVSGLVWSKAKELSSEGGKKEKMGGFFQTNRKQNHFFIRQLNMTYTCFTAFRTDNIPGGEPRC